MCYTVVVATEVCSNDHPQPGSGVLCWRHCNFQSHSSASTGQWDRLCVNHEPHAYIVVIGRTRTIINDDKCAICSDYDDLLKAWNIAIDANNVMEESYAARIAQLNEDIQALQKVVYEEDANAVNQAGGDFHGSYGGNNTEDPNNQSGPMERLLYLLDQRALVQVKHEKVQDELSTLRVNFHERREIIRSGRLIQDRAIIDANNKGGDLNYYFGREISDEEQAARQKINKTDWPIYFPPHNTKVGRNLDESDILDGDINLGNDSDFSDEDDDENVLYMG